MNILFWNTNQTKNKNNLTSLFKDSLIELLHENDLDILILAEYPYNTNELCKTINIISPNQYNNLPNISDNYRIRGIINNKFNVESLIEESRYQLIKITTSYYILIIAMIHNVSKLHSDTQSEVVSRFYKEIADYENKLSCDYTIAIGDFNLNPFDDACVGGTAMHALPFVNTVVSNPVRYIEDKPYKKFYNPTWKFFGNDKVPYTTYYHDKGGNINLYWYALDQVILRPSLIKAFDMSSFRVISNTKSHNFIKNGKPNNKYSDHLPLFCNIKEDEL